MNQAERARPRMTAKIEASAPKFPPLRMFGPVMAGVIMESTLFPETAKPNTLPSTKFQAQ